MADIYDPIINGPININRCPGLNMRNSIRNYNVTSRCFSRGPLSFSAFSATVFRKSCISSFYVRPKTTRCRSTRTSNLSIISNYVRNINKCFITYSTLIPSGNKTCNTSRLSPPTHITYLKRNLSCVTYMVGLLDPRGSKRCGNITWTPNHVDLYGLVVKNRSCITTSIRFFNGTSQTNCKSKAISLIIVNGYIRPQNCFVTSIKTSEAGKGFCGPITADPSSFPPRIFGRLMGGRQPRIFGTRDNGRMSGSPRFRK